MNNNANTDHPINQKALDFMTTGPKLLLIDGKWVPAQSGKTYETINPATEDVLTMVAEAGKEDIDLAVAAARRAYEDSSWAQIKPDKREAYLHKIADLLEANLEELANIETLDNGMPIRFSRLSVQAAASAFRYFGGWSTKVYGKTNPSDDSEFTYTLREPVGVVGAIIPWNGPIQFAAWKIAPALAFGNTVVLKPSELTPLSALRLGELLMEAGLPKGVVNILPGPGATAGKTMIEHMDVDKIAFTGSTAIGREILKASAGNMKRVTLELGGKSPVLIFPDADMERSVQTAIAGFTSNSGQACMSGTRLFVHESIYEEFSQRLAAAANAITVGDGMNPDIQMGPITNKKQFEKIQSYFTIGKEDGATIIAGGETVGDKGFYVKPTIFTHVSNEMRVAREEIFGPIAVLIPFKDEADAIRQANDSDYGLASCIYTNDLNRAHRVARALKAGMVWINTVFELSAVNPFGGYKQSGIGRELGEEAAETYTQMKSVIVKY